MCFLKEKLWSYYNAYMHLHLISYKRICKISINRKENMLFLSLCCLFLGNCLFIFKQFKCFKCLLKLPWEFVEKYAFYKQFQKGNLDLQNMPPPYCHDAVICFTKFLCFFFVDFSTSCAWMNLNFFEIPIYFVRLRTHTQPCLLLYCMLERIIFSFCFHCYSRCCCCCWFSCI